MAPEARKDQLLAQDVGDEVVLFDERTAQATRLNRTAALVWRLANGRRSIGELATLAHEALGVPEDEEFVRLALDELEAKDLLTARLPDFGRPISRREMFTQAASLLPVAVSITTPTPNRIGSQPCPPGTTGVFPACIPVTQSCPSGATGVPPACICPAGQTYNAGTNQCIATPIQSSSSSSSSSTGVGPITLSDATFANASWDVTTRPLGGTTATVEQRPEGNPGLYRFMRHNHPGNFGETAIEVYHRYLGGSYDPRTQGAITNINYGEDRNCISGTTGALAMVFQDGILYFATLPNVSVGGWTRATRNGLVASNFTSRDGTRSPNFTATGTTIFFGFTRNSNLEYTPEADFFDGGIDNWTVTINRQAPLTSTR